MIESSNDGGKFTAATLNLIVTIPDISRTEKANELHEKANELFCSELLKFSCLPQTNLYTNNLTGKNNGPLTKVSAKAGLDNITSAMCKYQPRSGSTFYFHH